MGSDSSREREGEWGEGSSSSVIPSRGVYSDLVHKEQETQCDIKEEQSGEGKMKDEVKGERFNEESSIYILTDS